MSISKKDYNMCKNAVRSVIRKSFSRSEHYKAFVDSHRIEWKQGNRKRVSYKCNHCKEDFKKDQINVDHILPIGKGAYRELGDAAHFYNLVYCDHSNLQILCKGCHKSKSQEEQKSPSFDNALF